MIAMYLYVFLYFYSLMMVLIHRNRSDHNEFDTVPNLTIPTALKTRKRQTVRRSRKNSRSVVSKERIRSDSRREEEREM